MNCLFRCKTSTTREVATQTDISFVHNWSLTNEIGTIVNGEGSGAVFWDTVNWKGSKESRNGSNQCGHKPDTHPRPLVGYSGFR